MDMDRGREEIKSSESREPAQLVQLSLFHSYSRASAEYVPVEQLDVAQQWNYLKDNVM